MTTYFEGNRGVFLGAQAWLIENDREMASSWATPYVNHNPAYKWVLGRFVESDKANNNKQMFSLAGLQMSRPTIDHAPMNMNHSARRVVGAYVATDLIYPTDSAELAGELEPSDPGTYHCPNCGEPIVPDDLPEEWDPTDPDQSLSCPHCNTTIDNPSLMTGCLEEARSFSKDQRKGLAKDGKALPNGSFPIENEGDLKNAIQAVGRAKDATKAKQHIIGRAKALGLTKLLPKSWMTDRKEKAGLTDAGLNPYIEALGVFWRHYFPEEYSLVEAAHAEGRLYYSMECIPAQVQCAGAAGCGETYQYAGAISPSYCSHLNEHASDKMLIDPHFTAGAILVPPVRPGWSNADIHSLVAKHAELAEHIYDGVKSDLSHLDPRDWELLMHELLVISSK